jgi:hypothetical protein
MSDSRTRSDAQVQSAVADFIIWHQSRDAGFSSVIPFLDFSLLRVHQIRALFTSFPAIDIGATNALGG